MISKSGLWSLICFIGYFFLSYRAISCFALVKLKGKEKKSNKRIAMLSEINDHIEHKHFATFMNNFPSLCVYGPLPLSISVYLLTADGVHSQWWALRLSNGLPSHSQEQRLAEGTGHAGSVPPWGSLWSVHLGQLWNSGEKLLPNGVGQARIHDLSCSPRKTLVVVILAPSRCPDQMHKPVILSWQSYW